MQRFRIYGDNILECEEALRLLALSLDVNYSFIGSRIYAPEYVFSRNTHMLAQVQLCPGYGRWNYDVQADFLRRGALLREAPDAVVTLVQAAANGYEEVPLLALEFSGALPAGNNAWQRCGRALGCAQAEVPYLYFAELGGVELDNSRNIKAARFPNPIIPFAYYALGHTYDTFAMPVYQPSPSITTVIASAFSSCFGGDEVGKVVAAIVRQEPAGTYLPQLQAKALGVTQALANRSSARGRTLTASEWESLGNKKSGIEKVDWFIDRAMRWRKGVGIKVTSTFTALLQKSIDLGACAVGSTDLPFCILPGAQRPIFGRYLDSLYPGKLSPEFIDWISSSQEPLVLVWIAGFKPAGEDSRPDRGLVPLVRMVLGEEVDLLSIIYGPGRPAMWRQFQNDLWKLAETNGLWQAIAYLSDGILIDHPNAAFLNSYGVVIKAPAARQQYTPPLLLDASSDVPKQTGEHDVDSVLHMVFSVLGDEIFFEGLCNPPGGNWSGLSIFDRSSNMEIRWVSLPRVSGKHAKRPDHVFQFFRPGSQDILLVVESKDRAVTVEREIGTRLTRYMEELLYFQPNICRSSRKDAWGVLNSQYSSLGLTYVTAAAFQYRSSSELAAVLDKSGVDIVFGVEFDVGEAITLHVQARQVYQWLLDALITAQKSFGDRLVVKIY